MNTHPRSSWTLSARVLLGCAIAGASILAAMAAPPLVKTVPWIPSTPLIPHETWSGREITLKGTSDVEGAGIQYSWNFGDGSPAEIGAVMNKYVVQALHAYTGSPGTVYTATLTIEDTATGESATSSYYVKILAQALPVEVNVAIDEGLWNLHRLQQRTGTEGYWAMGGSYGGGSSYAATAACINAFEVNGHLESGPASNPYTETVNRGIRQMFVFLNTYAIYDEGLGNPDANGNGYGVYVNQGNYLYQGGMFIDALVSSGTPNAVAPTGIPAAGSNPGILGRTYREIVQDMVDFYSFSQYNNSAYGGWRYGINDFPDNSACQWAAIGILAAEREWGASVPVWVKDSNLNWLTYSQDVFGRFGYTGPGSFAWGPFATTPSGLVQLAMDGKGRGDTRWDMAETFLRDNFENTGNYGSNIKAFYYGLFSFSKAMLLHDSNGDGIPEPITFLRSSTPGVTNIDWYSAEVSRGDPTDGLARTLVNDQQAGGSWPENSGGVSVGLQNPWAIIMLRRTVVALLPVAVAKATPNPAVVGQTIQLDGSDSFHLNPARVVDSWEWDFNNDGTIDATGPFASVSFPALGLYPVRLRVTDDGSPEQESEVIITIDVSIPPLAPTAVAGGPYSFCLSTTGWHLDGSGSINPDEGESETGLPGDTLTYAWDLDGDSEFDDATGAQPDVTDYFTARGPGSYVIQLRVTDTTSVSFPSSGKADQHDTESTVVTVREATAGECSCIDDLRARPKPRKVQLVWKPVSGVHHYNIARATVSGGPYVKIGVTGSTYSTYLDTTVVNGTTYYYVVREANILDQELCQSNEASAKPMAR